MTIPQLIERLEKAEGADTQINSDLATMWGVSPEGVTGPPYTSSIDAALSLVERVLPDVAAWDVGFAYSGGPYSARVFDVSGVEIETHHKSSHAIAILIALLKAVEGKDGE
jgi:hypothetical protein